MVRSIVRSIVRSMVRSMTHSRAACSQKAITYDDQRFASSDLHRWTRRIKGFQNMTLTHFWKCQKKRLFNLVSPQVWYKEGSRGQLGKGLFFFIFIFQNIKSNNQRRRKEALGRACFVLYVCFLEVTNKNTTAPLQPLVSRCPVRSLHAG